MTTHGGGPAYGEHLASRFGLERQQSHVSRSVKRGLLAVTQIMSDKPTPRPTHSIGYDEAWLVGLQLRDVLHHELWQDSRPVRVGVFANRGTTFNDLRRDPVALVRQPYGCLQFYLPRPTLVDIARQNGLRFGGELNCRSDVSHADPVIRALGDAMLPALTRAETIDGLFLDHILHAVALHVVGRYGDQGAQTVRALGGLAPWQERRAKEMMQAQLGGDVSLKDLATACDLSVSQFARAFLQSAGTSPHRWLRQRRIEKAIQLLSQQEQTLSEIAIACGFTDQSHFTRAFTQAMGVSPGRWRQRSGARR